ncbi:MAG: hypothetical protein APF78_01210 [Sphingomonadales bacterium BRH_c3]|nr:MAG: hypothetical protein APF78_01210 [Sphingomonadales bacterium BRH_c3]
MFGDSPLDMSAVRPAGYDVRETRFGPQPRVSNTLHLSLLPKEITTPGEGQVRALLMESGNVVVSAPGGDQLAAALETLELFVSHDIYVNETNRHAHYILPGATFLEREDMPTISFPHMVRPFAQYTDAVVRPTGEARAEHVVFNDLGRRLHDLLSADPGASGYAAAAAPLCDPMATVDDHFAATGAQAPIDGKMVPLTVDLLKAMPEGIILADNLVCTNSLGKVRHPDGIHLWNALLDDEVIRMRGTAPPAAGDLRLFGMRTLGSINSWMHNVDRLVRSQKPMLLIHPEDAASRGIVTGDMVVIRSDSGTLRVKCDVTDAVAPGAVCYPHGWGHRGGWRRANATPGANINMLADPEAGEKLSASSLLDGIRVEVTRVTK